MKYRNLVAIALALGVSAQALAYCSTNQVPQLMFFNPYADYTPPAGSNEKPRLVSEEPIKFVAFGYYTDIANRITYNRDATYTVYRNGIAFGAPKVVPISQLNGGANEVSVSRTLSTPELSALDYATPAEWTAEVRFNGATSNGTLIDVCNSYTIKTQTRPTAAQNAPTGSMIVSSPVSFSATGSMHANSVRGANPSSISYEWDFGDGVWVPGNSSTSHVFTATGTYNVKVRSFDGKYNSIVDAGATRTVTIIPNPNQLPIPTLSVLKAGCSYQNQFYDVRWGPNGGNPIEYYAVEYSEQGSPFYELYTGLDLETQFSGQSGISYAIRVKSCNSGGANCSAYRTKNFTAPSNCSGSQ